MYPHIIEWYDSTLQIFLVTFLLPMIFFFWNIDSKTIKIGYIIIINIQRNQNSVY